jgi:hypothetical protein
MPAQKFNHSGFSDAAPPAGKPLQLLCEDEAGQYCCRFVVSGETATGIR